MRILITGHKGFIGQNIMSYLETKHEVAGYDFHPENLPLVKDYDWVIHLGAISSTTETDVDKVIRNYFSLLSRDLCSFMPEPKLEKATVIKEKEDSKKAKEQRKIIQEMLQE